MSGEGIREAGGIRPGTQDFFGTGMTRLILSKVERIVASRDHSSPKPMQLSSERVVRKWCDKTDWRLSAKVASSQPQAFLKQRQNDYHHVSCVVHDWRVVKIQELNNYLLVEHCFVYQDENSYAKNLLSAVPNICLRHRPTLAMLGVISPSLLSRTLFLPSLR